MTNFKGITKSLIGLVAIVAGFLQSDAFRAWLAPIILAHPKATIILTAAAFITALLHNPLVKSALKLEGVAPDASLTTQSVNPQSGFVKLGAVLAICAVLLGVGVMATTTSCTSSQVTAVVQKIWSFLPTVESINSDVAAVVSVLDPKDAVLIEGVTAMVNNGLKELQTLTAAYTANPSESTWKNIVALVDSIVTNGDAALLQAAKISDPASQVKATTIIGALDAALHIIDGWVASTQTPAQASATAAARTTKLQSVVRYWSQQDKDRVAREMGARDFNTVFQQATALGY